MTLKVYSYPLPKLRIELTKRADFMSKIIQIFLKKILIE